MYDTNFPLISTLLVKTTSPESYNKILSYNNQYSTTHLHQLYKSEKGNSRNSQYLCIQIIFA